MAEGRQRDEWTRTSATLAMIANTTRDPKRRPKPFGPLDFYPFDRPSGTGGDGHVEVPLRVLLDGLFPGTGGPATNQVPPGQEG